MDHPSNIDDHRESLSPAYHLGYADGLANIDPYDERDDYWDGHLVGSLARGSLAGTPTQLRRTIAEHRMAALRTRAEQLGLDQDGIIELDLKSNAVPQAKPHGRPRTTIDRSSVGYGRGAA